MDTRGLLDQLLKSGQQMLQEKTGAQGKTSSPSPGGLGGLLGGSGGLGGLLSGAGGGALAASVLGMLLGNKSARKYGGQALSYGGLAALGVLAYKAYGNWQANQGKAPQTEPQTIDRVAPQQVEQHSQAILKALVAAAKADGHIDDRERQLIDGEFSKLDSDPALQQWLKPKLTSHWTRLKWRVLPARRKSQPKCTSPACFWWMKRALWKRPICKSWPSN